jgi:hypothetical protein
MKMFNWRSVVAVVVVTATFAAIVWLILNPTTSKQRVLPTPATSTAGVVEQAVMAEPEPPPPARDVPCHYVQINVIDCSGRE